jgi:hypothetical protein
MASSLPCGYARRFMLKLNAFFRAPAVAALILGLAGWATASAQTYATSFSGVTIFNGAAPEDFKTEFPVGTAWTIAVAWDVSAAPLATYAKQVQYRLLDYTLTLSGQSGDFVTSALPGTAVFTVTNNFWDTSHNVQFTNSGGAANLTTGSILGASFTSINVVFTGLVDNGPASLSGPYGSFDTGLYDLTSSAPDHLKIYLNDNYFSPLFGEISAPVTPVPEPSTYAVMVGAVVLGFALWRRRRRRQA